MWVTPENGEDITDRYCKVWMLDLNVNHVTVTNKVTLPLVTLLRTIYLTGGDEREKEISWIVIVSELLHVISLKSNFMQWETKDRSSRIDVKLPSLTTTHPSVFKYIYHEEEKSYKRNPHLFTKIVCDQR